MFQYEFEKRPPSSTSCDSRATVTTDWSQTFPSLPEQRRKQPSSHECSETYPSGHESSKAYPSGHETSRASSRAYPSSQESSKAYPSGHESSRASSRAYPSSHESSKAYSSGHESSRAYHEAYRTRPLPPRPVCERVPTVPTKSSVPLKVWVIASASCFAVCAALVLATVVITRWGAGQTYTREMVEEPELIYSNPHPVYYTPKPLPTTTEPNPTTSNEIDDDIDVPILEKLSIFKNIVVSREKSKKIDDLASKPQIHPIHDTTVEHLERKIEKKDQAKMPNHAEVAETAANEVKRPYNEVNDPKRLVPDFKPTLPDVFWHNHGEIKLPDGYMVGLRKHDSDFEEYYNDDNLYDDYMQSNTMTNYLIEKVQELHDWITTDPDFESVKNSSKIAKGTEFTQVLQALNESLIQGNVSIIMSKLKDIYFGDNYTNVNHSRKMIVSNSTDLLSFGILTLDIMLLHNIQLMAWENQEAVRIKMLKDPDVFAFNALFMDPSKVEAKQNEIAHHHDTAGFSKRQNLRQDDDFDMGKSLLESLLEIGMSSARAAIHLGRAYKNTKSLLTQLTNRDALNTNIQAQLSRNIDDNTVALNHLQSSFQGAEGTAQYTALDCVWLLYCRSLSATGKLATPYTSYAPYGTMARINGMALRMLVGELSTDKALETLVYEALTGWTELKCDEMFPRCSKVDAASVVMDMIMQPVRKTQSNRL